MSDYSEAFREAVNAQQTGEKIHILVTVEHPDLVETIRINNSVQNIVSRGQTFLAHFLEATILDQDPERSPQAQLRVSNIKREMVAALRTTNIPSLITMEVVRGSDPDYVELSLTNLELRNVEYDEMLIQGDLIPKQLKARKAVDFYFTPNTAPSLFKAVA
jgi:hypothetical protein